MEGNRDEAQRCLRIAEQRLGQGDHASASKFAKKSISMFPTDKAKVFIKELESQKPKDSTPASAPGSSSAPGDQGLRNRAAKSTKLSGSGDGKDASQSSSKPYTSEQVKAVNKIKACKNEYYMVLVIQISYQDAEINKAYRKVYLLLYIDGYLLPNLECGLNPYNFCQ